MGDPGNLGIDYILSKYSGGILISIRIPILGGGVVGPEIMQKHA